jgi:hypothetical protein
MHVGFLFSFFACSHSLVCWCCYFQKHHLSVALAVTLLRSKRDERRWWNFPEALAETQSIKEFFTATSVIGAADNEQ